MKKIISQTLLILLASSVLVGCKKAAKPTNTNQYQDVTVTDNTTTNTQVAIESATIHFDFDRSDVRSADEEAVVSFANAVQVGNSITIEGHCDKRGTREYNLALGEKRANAVRSFLESGGFKGTIQTVSYGKDKPINEEDSSKAHAENRRAVLMLDK